MVKTIPINLKALAWVLSEALDISEGRILDLQAGDAQEEIADLSDLVSILEAGGHATASQLRGQLDAMRASIGEPSPSVFEAIAIENGWRHGGDNGGFWYDGKEFDSWKAAASADVAATYATAKEVCANEGYSVDGWQ